MLLVERSAWLDSSLLAEDMAVGRSRSAGAAEKWTVAWLCGRPSHGSFRASALLQFGFRSRRDRAAGLSPRGFSPMSWIRKRAASKSCSIWRRTWDSNPRGCYTLLAFQASSLATRSILQISVFLLSLRATCINLTQMVVGCKWNL